MSAFEPAGSHELDANMDAILAKRKDKSRMPIYVHCKHGQDRTGVVIGLERVVNEGWAPQEAHDEMVQIGFHTFFAGSRSTSSARPAGTRSDRPRGGARRAG